MRKYKIAPPPPDFLFSQCNGRYDGVEVLDSAMIERARAIGLSGPCPSRHHDIPCRFKAGHDGDHMGLLAGVGFVPWRREDP